ncbi:uncharacterized protein EV154DRAFT_563671 [Mucor mucedo]|uniref:uncharacterized protein n=1 Tax=Mucor mucedo TaxID=29922 RepID=UPI0022201AEC|nr:uncharacterized protein EV154DRAFT_563671 [Mucor mucedo]KAI7891038.1 hypothetical protein EV154DRAFT_563671 [Mucor mucedo]
MNQYTFNKTKVVIDLTKLQELLNKKGAVMKEFLGDTIDDMYELTFSEKQKNSTSKENHLKIKKKASKEKIKTKPEVVAITPENIKNESKGEQVENNVEIVNSQDNEHSQVDVSQFPNSGFSESNVRVSTACGETSQGDQICENCTDRISLLFGKANMCVTKENNLKENLASIRLDSELSIKYVKLINTSNENMVKAYMYIKQQDHSLAIHTLVEMVKALDMLEDMQDVEYKRFFDLYYEMFNEEYKYMKCSFVS